jgi:outer membrane protein assembly factor BamB
MGRSQALSIFVFTLVAGVVAACGPQREKGPELPEVGDVRADADGVAPLDVPPEQKAEVPDLAEVSDLSDLRGEEVVSEVQPELPPDVCAPDCHGRECGDDGCSGECGTCGEGMSCDSAGQCVPVLEAFGPSKTQHTVDGRFTGYEEGDPEHEWFDIPPFESPQGRVYFDYQKWEIETRLNVLLDWSVLSEATTRSRWMAQFYTGGGNDLWTVVTNRDGQVRVFLAGKECTDCEAAASVGRGRSPGDEAEHVIVELALKVNPGGIGLKLFGPEASGDMAEDPAVYAGDLVPGGSCKIKRETELAWVAGASPDRCVPRGIVRIAGTGFGEEPGECFIGGEAAEVVSWTSTSIIARVSDKAKGSGLVVVRTDGQGAPLPGVHVADGFEDSGGIVNLGLGPDIEVDGEFTQYDPTKPWLGQEWWMTAPVPGTNGYYGLEYNGLELVLLLDWAWFSPLTGQKWIGFSGWTDGGETLWDIRVLADGTSEVRRNGKKCGCGVLAKWSERASPWVGPEEHAVAEIRLQVSPGDFAWQVWGPGDSDEPVGDSAVISGRAWEGGGVVIGPSTEATLVALKPAQAKGGTPVAAEGTKLGSTQGKSYLLFADNQAAEVSFWSQEKVVATVPADAVSGFVRVHFVDGASTNGVWFVVPGSDTDGDGVNDEADNCPAVANPSQSDIDGDELGNECDPEADGDGYANYEDVFPLDPAEWADSDADGVGDNGDQFPDDPGEWLDSDGDGVGDNGDCKPLDPQLSVPQCDGKQCGDDLCGGSCGTCPGVLVCQESQCGFDFTKIGKSQFPHTVDGLFTGWTAGEPPDTFEWYDVPPVAGVYSNAYIDFDGTTLYLMNDWHLNASNPLSADCFNQFFASTGDGQEQWLFKVYANGKVTAYLNGQKLSSEQVKGMYGWAKSPLVGVDHSLFELRFPAKPGAFAVTYSDPGEKAGCDVLETEPTVLVGELSAGGGLLVAGNPNVAWIAGANPAGCAAGCIVRLVGIGFGGEPGTVTVGGKQAEVRYWADGAIVIVVPAGAPDGGIRVTAASGWLSNVFPFDLMGVGEEPGTVVNPRSRYPHTVDGKLTDWNPEAPPAEYEWHDVIPAVGQYTYAFFDYDGEYLYILNDWKYNDVAALQPDCYNHFVAFTGGGMEQWDVLVYGSGKVEVLRNGDPYDGEAQGYAGFGPSPLYEKPHSIFELRLPALPGGFGVQLHDPGPSFNCLQDMATEPTNFQGDLEPVGGSDVLPSLKGTLFALKPPAGVVGTPVAIDAGGLGEGQAGAILRFGGDVAATVSYWSDNLLVTSAPTSAVSGWVYVLWGDGKTTNKLWFLVPDSDGDEDGIKDGVDNCPGISNPSQADLDKDGQGDLCDIDIDGDDVRNILDKFPYDPNEVSDEDGDGTGDNGDNCPELPNPGQADLDKDGWGDACDDDLDGDGVPNVADLFPDDPAEWADSDGDGVGDNGDDFPLDPAEWADTDGDGVGDNGDAFPQDPTEWLDFDGDGVGDNGDEFPLDPTEWADTDGDGVGDNADCQPADPEITGPDCSGRECGSDSCGGSCGTCPGNLECLAGGKCAWYTCGQIVGCMDLCDPASPQLMACLLGCAALGSPDAQAKAVLLDNCRKVQCPQAVTKDDIKWCLVEKCSAQYAACHGCLPSCKGKQCGDDGCGGSCGGCPGQQTCQQFQCAFTFTDVPKSKYPHTMDGRFTDWSAGNPPALFEWFDVPSAQGQYTNAYFDYDGQYLYILNDWFYNDALALENGCYNLFTCYTGGGKEQWQVKVYAEGTVQVFLNGAPYTVEGKPVTGAYSFDSSPKVTDLHTIYELRLPASSGGFGVQYHDPGPSSGCDVLETEPNTFVGDAAAGGGLGQVSNNDVPWITASNPAAGVPGTPVRIFGVALGASAGTATIGGKPATVISWSSGTVGLLVPAGADDSGIRLLTVAGWWTNTLPFDVIGEGDEPAAVVNPKSQYPHTVDGEFTDWVAGKGSFEWHDVVPATGKYTYAYFDYDGEYLYILNDWHVNDVAALQSDCFNHFKAWTGGGTEQWDLKVFGDGHVEVLRNGKSVTPEAEGVQGALGFHESPLVAGKHTVFELRFPAAPGGFGVQLHDPGPSFDCKADMLTEPANFQGALDPHGGQYVIPSGKGTLFALKPAHGLVGTPLVAEGASLGNGQGAKLLFEQGIPAATSFWSDNLVVASAPAGFVSGFVKVVFADGSSSNGLWFTNDDGDGDLVPDEDDNCPLLPNGGQEDLDGDGVGDACDPDQDGDGFTPQQGDCNDTVAAISPNAVEVCSNVTDDNCDGKVDEGCTSLGSGAGCSDILAKNPAAASGVYDFDPDGEGGKPAFKGWCDMATDGGGWTLVFKQSNHETADTILNESLAGSPLLIDEDFDGTTPGSILGLFQYDHVMFKGPEQSIILYEKLSSWADLVTYSCRDISLAKHKCLGNIDCAVYKHIYLLTGKNPFASAASAFIVGTYHSDYPNPQCGEVWCSNAKHGRYDGGCTQGPKGIGNWMLFVRKAKPDGDGDGVPDDEDAFPKDPKEWADSDKDGVGDNSDAFPNDPTEWADTDMDGVGNNADCAPNDPLVSAPSCTGKECGDDGCGGSCGSCNAGFTCNEAKCVPVQQGPTCGDTSALQAGAPWPMVRGCPLHTGRTPFTPSDKLKTKWVYLSPQYSHANPAVGADGTLYFGTYDKKLVAVNPDGTFKWEFLTGGQIYNVPAIGKDGTIYVGSGDKKVYAVNPDGTKKWEYLTTNWDVGSSAAVGPGNLVYVQAEKLYAFNGADGTVAWSFLSGAGSASPAVDGNGVVYTIGTNAQNVNNRLYAVNPDGTLKWEYGLPAGDINRTAPVVAPDGTVYVGGAEHDPYIHAIGPDGKLKWEYLTGSLSAGLWASPALAVDGTVYIGNDKLWAFNPDGSVKWEYATGGSVTGSPVILGDASVLVPSSDKRLYRINPNGTAKSIHLVNDDIGWGWGGSGSIVVVSDGTLYVRKSDGSRIYALGTCAPTCNGAACGDDGCGGQCGTCAVGTSCNLGHCDPCTPQCAGKSCGNDGCGGSCGACTGTLTCSAAFQCVESCGAKQGAQAGSPFPMVGWCQTHVGRPQATGPTEPEIKWTFATTDAVKFAPVVAADGTIYATSYDKKLYAINPDGSQKWLFAGKGYAAAATAIGGDGSVYWPVFSQGHVQAVNPADGTQKWQWSGYSYAPITVGPDGNVFVAGTHLYNLNPATGVASWTFNVNVTTYSAPAVYYPSQGLPWYVAHAAGTKVYWVSSAGVKQWEFVTLENEQVSNASPLVTPDGNIVVSGGNSVYSISKAGVQNWRLKLPGKPGSPALGSDGTFYVAADDKRIYAIGPAGNLKWEHLSVGTLTSPLIDLSGTIWVGAGTSLVAVNPDGTSELVLPLGGAVTGIAMGSTGTIYASSTDKKVIAAGQK